MRSSYRRIGDYIELVDERNKDLSVDLLLGLSISKEFIPSVANTVDTNMKNYKIIQKRQFACSVMQVRRDKKMPIALLKDHKVGIISQAYPVFKIKDENKLLPQYLMMWFCRPEFDREACFYAVGGVRGSLEWEDFCNMKLPVPSIEKQQKLVAEYNTVVNRIKLNEQLNQKLEETAQAVYRRWFVEFEENKHAHLQEYVETNPKLNLEKGTLAPYIEMANISETSFNISNMIYRRYKGGSRFQNNDTLLARITPCLENGKTAFVNFLKEDEVAAGSTEFIVMRAKENVSPYWVYCLAKDENFRSFAISSMVGSSGRQRVHESYLGQYELPKINWKNMESFHNSVRPFFESVKLNSLENQKLSELKTLLLSKMTKVGMEKQLVE